jgi:hypothetical protein
MAQVCERPHAQHRRYSGNVQSGEVAGNFSHAVESAAVRSQKMCPPDRLTSGWTSLLGAGITWPSRLPLALFASTRFVTIERHQPSWRPKASSSRHRGLNGARKRRKLCGKVSWSWRGVICKLTLRTSAIRDVPVLALRVALCRYYYLAHHVMHDKRTALECKRAVRRIMERDPDWLRAPDPPGDDGSRTTYCFRRDSVPCRLRLVQANRGCVVAVRCCQC